jgi:hypothetical protein
LRREVFIVIIVIPVRSLNQPMTKAVRKRSRWASSEPSTNGNKGIAKLLEALDKAHANDPTAEELELLQAWKRQHRRRTEGEW